MARGGPTAGRIGHAGASNRRLVPESKGSSFACEASERLGDEVAQADSETAGSGRTPLFPATACLLAQWVSFRLAISAGHQGGPDSGLPLGQS